MHDCRSKRWSGTNRTAPLHPASNQLLLCWKLACLPACLQSSTLLVRCCIALGSLPLSSFIIVHFPWREACRFTAHSGRCQAASCLDRISSASETHVQVYMWSNGTKLSGDISPLRTVGVACMCWDQATHQTIIVAEDLLAYRSSSRSIYQHCLTR
jgi:hypothetical protein